MRLVQHPLLGGGRTTSSIRLPLLLAPRYKNKNISLAMIQEYKRFIYRSLCTTSFVRIWKRINDSSCHMKVDKILEETQHHTPPLRPAEIFSSGRIEETNVAPPTCKITIIAFFWKIIIIICLMIDPNRDHNTLLYWSTTTYDTSSSSVPRLERTAEEQDNLNMCKKKKRKGFFSLFFPTKRIKGLLDYE